MFPGRFTGRYKVWAVTGGRGFFFFLFALVLLSAGCGDSFFDPTQIGRFRPVPAVNIILDSLGVAEEAPSAWEGAEAPKPIDVMVTKQDYVFGPGDIVRVSIFELLRENDSFVSDYVVTETGKISILEVGVVQVEGLTESQFEEEIKQILSPSILKDPSVTVTLLQSEQRTFSIYGEGVVRPSRYSIPRTDFRLTDAISMAGGISQFNISYIYVSRPVTGEEAITEPAEPKASEPAEPELEIDFEKEMLEIIAPRAQKGSGTFFGSAPGGSAGKNAREALVITSSDMMTDKELAGFPNVEKSVWDPLAEAALPEGFEPAGGSGAGAEQGEAPVENEGRRGVARETIEPPINGDEAERVEWIFEEGRWVPVRVGVRKPSERPAEPTRDVPEDFGWDEIGTGGIQTRLIEIPADKLRSGDPRYNIVIKPGDSIHVPVDVIGEYFIYGNTNFQGAVVLTGRPLTLKMAIAAAGGLGALAWPRRCEVIRRIGENREEIVMVDLDKIAKGEQPDFFIKPLDLINVGTHPTARWRAVLRNAFRATYGFGFIYDRNFADRDFGTSRPLPNWF